MGEREEGDHWAEVEEAIALLEEGQLEESRQLLLAVTERNPGNEYAHFFLGNAYFEDNEYDKALRCYVSALEAKPGYAGALLGSGHALRLMGKLDSAIRVARELLARDNEDADGLFLLALSLVARGDDSEAKGLLQRFIDTRPELEASLEARALLEAIEERESG